jgi:DNA-directed RNA polymerase alpha subunit
MLAAVCPRKVFGLGKQLEVVDAQSCNFCGECKDLEKKLGLEPLITIEDGDFLFEIETTGSLSPDEILASALQQMDELLSGFLQQLGSNLYSAN